MKRQKLNKKLSILLVCVMMVFLVGCGGNNSSGSGSGSEGGTSAEPSASADTQGSDTGTQDDVASGSETGTGSDTGSGSGSGTGTGSESSGTNTNANGAGTAVTGTAQASKSNPINDDIEGYYSETAAYPLLENEIIDELDYENLDMTSTRYYYNYVDLNDDGVDEILVQLNGEYNTTEDGDTLLIVEQNKADEDDEDDGFDVEETFTAFVNPVVISDNKTNGYRDIIFMNADGTTYSKIEYGKDGYKDMKDAITLQNLDGITGVALLDNDIAEDTKNNTGLYFS